MKKKLALICVVIILLIAGTISVILYNNKHKDDSVYQKIAWDTLVSKSQQQYVIGSWKKGRVETIIINNKKIKVVYFHSTRETMIGEATIVISPETKEANIIPGK